VTTDWPKLEQFRLTTGAMASPAGADFGVFMVPRGKTSLRCVVSSGTTEVPWEHVSVCALDYKGSRLPTWDEMCFVKDLFWQPEECVMQLHPRHSEYVNNHAHVLHLWRPTSTAIPEPPSLTVGIKGVRLPLP
jgi:hypothetical protein